MEFVRSAGDMELSYWYCHHCQTIVDENSDKFKYPTALEVMEAKPIIICDFTRGEDNDDR